MMTSAVQIAQRITRGNGWRLVLRGVSYLLIWAIASCAGRSSLERKLRFDEATYAENLAAAQDTSRRLSVRVGTLGESLMVTQRRAVQQQQRGDALDRALRLERRARVALTVEVPRVRAAIAGEAAAASDSTANGGDVRRAHFRIEEQWYSGSADVVLPRPPGRPELSLDVGMRLIPLELRIGCSAHSPTGVAGASASVTGPRWAKVTLTRVEQDSGVCAVTEEHARTSRDLTATLRERLALVIGYGVAPGAWRPGAVVAAGVRLW